MRNAEYVEKAHTAVDELLESMDTVSKHLAASCRIPPINEAFKHLRRSRLAVRLARHVLDPDGEYADELDGAAEESAAPSGDEDPEVEEWPVSPSIAHSHYPRYVPPGSHAAFTWPKCLGPRFRGFVWHLEDGRKLIRQTCRPIMWSDGTDLVPGAEGVGWMDDTHPIDWNGMFRPVVADAVLMARESE